MRQHNYLTTINLSARSQVEVSIKYDFEPYVPGWFDYAAGYGEPPSGPEISIAGIHVTRIIAPRPLDRKWLIDHDFLKFVEDLVWSEIIDDDDLRYKLIYNAEEDYEDF
jgi:hypothetical protein